MKKIYLLILLIVSSYIHAAALENVSLQLKWKYQFQFAGYIVAKEKGFYKEAGLDVTLKEWSSSVNMHKDLQEGTVQFAISDSALILDAMKGEDIVALMANFQHSPYALMALKSSGIKTIHDINGKTVALDRNIDQIVIYTMLKANNINYIENVPDFTLDKLISGEIDVRTVYKSNEPFVALKMGYETVLFESKEYGFDGYGDLLFTSKDFLENSPAIVSKMNSASKKGWEYAFSHIDEVVDLIYDKYNTLNKTKEALKYEANVLKELSGYGKNFGQLDMERVKSIAQLYNFINDGKYRLDRLDDFIYQENGNKKVLLTKEEKDFLKKHPNIVLGTDKAWQPFVLIDKNGKVSGYDQEVLNLINQSTGANFTLKIGQWDEVQKEAKSNKIDGLSTGIAHPSRKDYLNFSDPYISLQSMLFTSTSRHKNIKSLEDIDGKTIGIQKGNVYEKKITSKFKNVKIIEFDRPDDIIEALITEKINILIGNPSTLYLANKLGMPYIKPVVKLDNKLVLSFGVRKDWPEAISIINKALEHIGEQKLSQLSAKWFLEKSADVQPKILLTKEEKEYIKNKKHIKVCTPGNHHPFVIKDKNSVKGLSIEYLNLISKKTALDFIIMDEKTITQHFNMIEDGKCDMVPLIVTKPNIHNFLVPTKPYASDNIVLVTKIYEPYISDLSTLTNQKIMVQKNAKNLIKYIQSIHPNLNLVEMEDIDMQKVVDDEFYGYIGSSYKIAYEIATTYFNDLKIMSKIGDKKLNGSMGITIREPVLLNIINKAIDDISKQEHNNIINNWVNIKVEKQINYTFIWQIIGLFSLIFFIVLIAYMKQRSLKNKISQMNKELEIRVQSELEKNKQQQLLMLHQSRLAQMGEMISMIAHQWRQPLNAISATSGTLEFKAKLNKLDAEFVQKKAHNISDFVQHLSATIDDFRNFFKPNKNKKMTTYDELVTSVLGIIEVSLSNQNIQLIQELNYHEAFNTYPSEVKQVILNLIKNAEDALLEKPVKDPYIKIATYTKEDSYILEVSDNAGGIPKKTMDKIYDPYFSTKETKNGTGLGLYMSKTIIEDHCGGELRVFNNDEGAVFKIILNKTYDEKKDHND